LRGDNVTDAGLKHCHLTHLSGLHLGEIKITDAGLLHLEYMAQLKKLWLNSTAVLQGVPALANLTTLEQIEIVGTRISEEGVKQLALPQCRIVYRVE
jgi:hypothetical protein